MSTNTSLALSTIIIAASAATIIDDMIYHTFNFFDIILFLIGAYEIYDFKRTYARSDQ